MSDVWRIIDGVQGMVKVATVNLENRVNESGDYEKAFKITILDIDGKERFVTWAERDLSLFWEYVDMLIDAHFINPEKTRKIPQNTVYCQIATAWAARESCNNSMNEEWAWKWGKQLDHIERNILPSGGGFDSRATIESVTDDKIIIHGSFHCMNEVGYYDGWIEFSVIVRPSLSFGFVLDVKARGMKWPRRYDDLRDYIHECYHSALSTMIDCNLGQ